MRAEPKRTWLCGSWDDQRSELTRPFWRVASAVAGLLVDGDVSRTGCARERATGLALLRRQQVWQATLAHCAGLWRSREDAPTIRSPRSSPGLSMTLAGKDRSHRTRARRTDVVYTCASLDDSRPEYGG